MTSPDHLVGTIPPRQTEKREKRSGFLFPENQCGGFYLRSVNVLSCIACTQGMSTENPLQTLRYPQRRLSILDLLSRSLHRDIVRWRTQCLARLNLYHVSCLTDNLNSKCVAVCLRGLTECL